MWIAAILLGIIQLVGFAGLGWFLRRYFERKQAAAIAAINDELNKLVAGEACQSASVLNAVGNVVGREAGRSAKAALMAELAHATRAANSDEAADRLAGLQETNPMLGALAGSMGKRGGSKLLQNPLIQLAFSALMNRQNGGAPSAPASASGSVAERLKKGQGHG